MKEIWKDIEGFEGIYQISDKGNVKSLNYRRTGKEMVLKPGTYGGYFMVNLYINGKSKGYKIHQLVCKTFLENINYKPCINHKNGIKTDNRLDNLEWVTYSENSQHSYDTGLQKGALLGKLGSKHHSSIAIYQYSKSGDFIKEFGSSFEAQRETGIHHSQILRCCKRLKKYKTAGGFCWRYKY